MKVSQPDNKSLAKIVVLVVIFVTFVKLVIDHELHGMYHDFGWRAKSLVIFVGIYSLIDLFREIKKWLKKKR
jgi:hypothetical protein